jgi:sulfoxide reductase catalytic subunit YedY
VANLRKRPAWELPERLATPESIYSNRRRVLAGLGWGGVGLGGLALGLGGRSLAAAPQATAPKGDADAEPAMIEPALGKSFSDRFPAPRNEAFGLGERGLTPEMIGSRYNNFYEFTTDKQGVWKLAQGYPVEPWTIQVTGRVRKHKTIGLEEIFAFPLEERLYRFRCVERWAMQVPWTGFPLRKLIESFDPLASAKYVRFVSVEDKEGLPGQRSQPWYPWPYFEGLRLDEAMHELAFVVVGSYGHALPMQHGAPLRIAMPWKYGYKSPKSIVAIELSDRKPATFWNDSAPSEYGFYSNVEPTKPHPRWSQAMEQDIGTGEQRKTLPYNGYAEQVAGLYNGSEF